MSLGFPSPGNINRANQIDLSKRRGRVVQGPHPRVDHRGGHLGGAGLSRLRVAHRAYSVKYTSPNISGCIDLLFKRVFPNVLRSGLAQVLVTTIRGSASIDRTKKETLKAKMLIEVCNLLNRYGICQTFSARQRPP